MGLVQSESRCLHHFPARLSLTLQLTIDSTTATTAASNNQHCGHDANRRWYPSPALVEFLEKKRSALDFEDEDHALEVSLQSYYTMQTRTMSF